MKIYPAHFRKTFTSNQKPSSIAIGFAVGLVALRIGVFRVSAGGNTSRFNEKYSGYVFFWIGNLAKHVGWRLCCWKTQKVYV